MLFGRRVGAWCVWCLVGVDRVFILVESVVVASSLFLCCLFRWAVYLLSFVVDWKFGSGYHCIVIAIHVDLSHCFCIFCIYNSLVARTFFLRTARSLRASHIFVRVTYTHGSSICKKGVCRMSVFVLCLAFSLLMFHPSLLCLYIHFGITFLSTSLPNFPVLKAQDTRHSAHASYLAKSYANTGYEPTEFDKITSVQNDTMFINDPDHNISDFSKNTHENKGLFGVLTMFESSVSYVSNDDFALQKESKESMQSGNRCWTERKRRKRRFCDQCCRVGVKERSTERY